MVMTYYYVMFAISFLLSIIYVFMWHRRFDAHLTAIFVLIPIITLSYVLMYESAGSDVALALYKIIYIGGCFLPWFVLMCIASLCRLEMSRGFRAVTFVISGLMYMSVLSTGHFSLFYKSFSFEKIGDEWVQHKEYGPLHTVFYIYVAVYFIMTCSAIIYGMRDRQVSRKVLNLLAFPEVVTIIGYIGNHFLGHGIDVMPLAYCISELSYIFIIDKVPLYDVSDMVIESMIKTSDSGFINIDFGRRYLGSNEAARQIVPALELLTVDHSIDGVPELENSVIAWLDRFEQEKTPVRSLVSRHDRLGGEDKIYVVNVNYMYDGVRRRGYQILMQDDTQNQRYIDLIDKYNSELEEEVAGKTERIVAMHDNLILGIATMVESRDNSTGGHIRRTSDGVRILMEAIEAEKVFDLPEEFGRKLIKAAPMHDLGKIAVDDAILRKPGKYTPEEFEKMKTHAAQGARIVFDTLRGTDDKAFKIIAENVAHYHHERWDGSGYPEGLKGDDIPVEARIMAVADVYDALVSKRIYKEKLSFEEANEIIMAGMGKHFDPKLKTSYLRARPKLEAYYRAQES